MRVGAGAGAGQRYLSVDTVTSFVEPLKSTLEAGQALTGLSWPVFIPCASIAVRLLCTTPLAILNRRRARRQRSLQPLLGASVPVIKAQLAQSVVQQRAQLTPEQIVVLAAKERRKRRVQLYREFGCQNWKVLLLPAVQIPVFCAMSLAVRALVGFDLSAETEFGNVDAAQFLWFRNLVEPDPLSILPLTIGALSLANVEMNAKAAVASSPAGLSAGPAVHRHKSTSGPSVAAALANISRAGSIVFMAISFQAPLALQLYWMSSNLFSLVQNMVLERFYPVSATVSYPFDEQCLPEERRVTDTNSQGMSQ
nr:Cox18 [Starmerella bombicola]